MVQTAELDGVLEQGLLTSLAALMANLTLRLTLLVERTSRSAVRVAAADQRGADSRGNRMARELLVSRETLLGIGHLSALSRELGLTALAVEGPLALLGLNLSGNGGRGAADGHLDANDLLAHLTLTLSALVRNSHEAATKTALTLEDGSVSRVNDIDTTLTRDLLAA